MTPIRILLVDDHSLLRLGLATLLKFQPDFTFVGGAENGERALELVHELQPDLVVMDLVMPGLGGVETTRLLKREFPGIHVLILTSFGTSADVARALEAGASGALLKDASDDELLAAMRTVAGGGTAFSPAIRRELDENPPPSFTDKQLGILESATRGLTNTDIAKQFGISPDAVKQHLNAVFTKLGAANRAEAAAIAIRRHLLRR